MEVTTTSIGDLDLDNLDIRRNTIEQGVILFFPKDAWLDSGLKKDVHHTGGHLGKKSGGHRDLHWWPSFRQVGCHLNGFKGCLTQIRVEIQCSQCRRSPGYKKGRSKWPPFFNFDVMRKWGVIFMVQRGVWLKSELSFNVHSARGHLVIKKGRSKWPPL